MKIINLFSSFDPSFKNLRTRWIIIVIILIILNKPKKIIKPNRKLFKTLLTNITEKENKLKSKSIKIILISSLFILIISINYTRLIPYTFTITRHIRITLSIALPLWLSPLIFGIIKKTKTLLSHLTPIGTPYPIIILIVIIETVRLLIRPITLSVRLAANITSGHLLITLLSTQSKEAQSKIRILIQIALLILEIIVSIIQAYVFRILLSLYISENIN